MDNYTTHAAIPHAVTPNSMTLLLFTPTPVVSLLLIMPTHLHKAGVTHILNSSPARQKSCLLTCISTLQAGSSKI